MADSSYVVDQRGIDAINQIKAENAADQDEDIQDVSDVIFGPVIPDAVRPDIVIPPNDVDSGDNVDTGPDPDFVNVPIQQPPNPMKLATGFDREIFAAQNKIRTEPEYYLA
jgi:hypothetical protein